MNVASAIGVGCILFMTSIAGAQDEWQDDWEEEKPSPVAVHGFVEATGSSRIVEDPQANDDLLLGEVRFRMDLSHYSERADMLFKGDVVHDALRDESLLDIRQALIRLRSGTRMDWLVGRQVLTWGTGDLLFLNDLFPKDFVSFFTGRDDEFLKSPSNTLKMSVYSAVLNLDLTWTPVFTADATIDGEVLSFTDPATGMRIGPASPQTPVSATEPPRTFANGEWAARAYRRLGSIEAAAYGYYGRFKQPTATLPQSMQPTYARMASGGASARGNLLGGLYNLEAVHYASLDDAEGRNPDVPNSESRGLVGYEHELRARLTLGVQYYIEWIHHHDRLLANSMDPATAPAEDRQLATARLTWRLLQETLVVSAFGFVDLRNGDTHWRPSITRDWSDNVKVTAGANVMTGDAGTFFGQLRNNTNAYLRIRYSL